MKYGSFPSEEEMLMQMQYGSLRVGRAIALVAGAGGAAVLTSTFDVEIEGWGVSNGNPSFVPTGGNPDSYLSVFDANGLTMELRAPGKFLRPLMVGGAISFEAIEEGNPYLDFSGFGIVTIEGAGDSVSADLFAGDLGDVWTTVSGALTGAQFGVSDARFAMIAANPTAIRVTIESGSEVSERVGFDNFAIDVVSAVVPLPAAAPMLIAGLAAIGLLGWRR